MREMKKKVIVALLVLAFSTVSLHLSINNTVSESISTATVSIDPPSIEKQIGENFEINITVADVTNLRAFGIWLYYPEGILTFLGADADHSLLKGPSDLYIFEHRPEDGGKARLSLAWSPQTAPQSGSFTLVTVRFNCIQVGDGEFLLDKPFDMTLLLDSRGDPIPWTRPENPWRCNVTGITGTVRLDRPQYYTLPVDVYFTTRIPVFNVLANDVVLDLNGHTINNIKGIGFGIKVGSRNNNVTIKNGTITNFQWGIEITNGADQVNIFNVTIFHCSETAIKIEDSAHVLVCNSKVSDSVKEGISLSNCNFSEFSHNILSGNGAYGIDLTNSGNNNISCNRIRDNTPAGIFLWNANQSAIFNNDFINNTAEQESPTYKPKHVEIHEGSIDFWSSSYPHGGNYWDDWNSTTRPPPRIVDEKSGFNHAIPGPDGIGDTPYVIDENNRDGYPLINPYDSVLQVRDLHRQNKTLSYAVFTNSSVADFNFTRSIDSQNRTVGLISFSVSGSAFCKVIVSRKLLDGAFETEVNGTPVASFLNWDGDFMFANFTTYGSGSHQVRVCGEIVRQCDLNADGKVDILDIALVAKDLDR